MKTRLLIATLACLALPFAASAQSGGKSDKDKKAPAQKSPADTLRDEFNKARNESGKFDQAQFEKIIKPGLAFLQQFPTNGNAPAVLRDIIGWVDLKMLDRKVYGPQRVAYLSHLKYLLLNERYKDGLSEDAKAALAALDVALFDAEIREGMQNKGAVPELREKIDALAGQPKTGRFLADREASYVQITNVLFGPERGEAHLQKLTEHKEKGVSDMAKRELNLIALKKDPVNWKIKGLDGKEFDFAQNRGKIIAVYFWSTTNRDAAKTVETLKMVQSDYRKKGLELVTISYDKAEDREKLEKFIKENGIKYPVAFDGTGNKNEFGSKLNVTSSPKLAIFDQKGVLFHHDLQANQLEGAVKRLLEAPKKKT